MGEPSCSVEDCPRPAARGRKGWCSPCYQRWRRWGDPRGGRSENRPAHISEREWILMGHDRSGGDDACWLWTRGTDGETGYGKAQWQGSPLRTHVIMWMIANEAEVPEGLEICHSCVDRRLCGNPAHLRADTRKANVKDMFDAGRAPERKKTHCNRGHELVPGNLYIYPSGKRQCLTCQKMYRERR